MRLSDKITQAVIEGQVRDLADAYQGAMEEIERLRSKVEAMERQKPIATVRINAINGNPSVDFAPGHRYLHHNDKLYLAPGAQSAPSFADAYQGAMEEVSIWKKRALEAEDMNRKLIAEIERQTCAHEETHRGGFLWEICDSCGAKWADDEGGKPEFKWPKVVEKARAMIEGTPIIPEGWTRAIDEALVVAHIGAANESDTYEQAKAKLNNLIDFHVDVATDPAVNGGYKLVSVRLTPKTKGD